MSNITNYTINGDNPYNYQFGFNTNGASEADNASNASNVSNVSSASGYDYEELNKNMVNDIEGVLSKFVDKDNFTTDDYQNLLTVLKKHNVGVFVNPNYNNNNELLNYTISFSYLKGGNKISVSFVTNVEIVNSVTDKEVENDLEKIIHDFALGNYTQSEAVKALNDKGVTGKIDVKTNTANYTVLSFSYKGKTYHAECWHEAVFKDNGKAGFNGKPVGLISAEMYNSIKSDELKKYYKPVVWVNGENNVKYYAPADYRNWPNKDDYSYNSLKNYLIENNKIIGSKDGISDINYKFEELVESFARGNLKTEDFEKQLKSLGAEYKSYVVASIIEMTVTLNDKTFKVSCNTKAANDGKDGNDGTSIIVEKFIESIGYGIEDYYYPVAWTIDKEGNETPYLYTPVKSKWPQGVEQFDIQTLQTYLEAEYKKANKEPENSSEGNTGNEPVNNGSQTGRTTGNQNVGNGQANNGGQVSDDGYGSSNNQGSNVNNGNDDNDDNVIKPGFFETEEQDNTQLEDLVKYYTEIYRDKLNDYTGTPEAKNNIIKTLENELRNYYANNQENGLQKHLDTKFEALVKTNNITKAQEVVNNSEADDVTKLKSLLLSFAQGDITQSELAGIVTKSPYNLSSTRGTFSCKTDSKNPQMQILVMTYKKHTYKATCLKTAVYDNVGGLGGESIGLIKKEELKPELASYYSEAVWLDGDVTHYAPNSNWPTEVPKNAPDALIDYLGSRKDNTSGNSSSTDGTNGNSSTNNSGTGADTVGGTTPSGSNTSGVKTDKKLEDYIKQFAQGDITQSELASVLTKSPYNLSAKKGTFSISTDKNNKDITVLVLKYNGVTYKAECLKEAVFDGVNGLGNNPLGVMTKDDWSKITDDVIKSYYKPTAWINNEPTHYAPDTSKWPADVKKTQSALKEYIEEQKNKVLNNFIHDKFTNNISDWKELFAIFGDFITVTKNGDKYTVNVKVNKTSGTQTVTPSTNELKQLLAGSVDYTEEQVKNVPQNYLKKVGDNYRLDFSKIENEDNVYLQKSIEKNQISITDIASLKEAINGAIDFLVDDFINGRLNKTTLAERIGTDKGLGLTVETELKEAVDKNDRKDSNGKAVDYYFEVKDMDGKDICMRCRKDEFGKNTDKQNSKDSSYTKAELVKKLFGNDDSYNAGVTYNVLKKEDKSLIDTIISKYSLEYVGYGDAAKRDKTVYIANNLPNGIEGISALKFFIGITNSIQDTKYKNGNKFEYTESSFGLAIENFLKNDSIKIENNLKQYAKEALGYKDSDTEASKEFESKWASIKNKAYNAVVNAYIGQANITITEIVDLYIAKIYTAVEVQRVSVTETVGEKTQKFIDELKLSTVLDNQKVGDNKTIKYDNSTKFNDFINGQSDIYDEVGDTIELLRKPIKEKLKSVLGDAFNENKFNKNFDDLKTDIVNNAGTYKQSEAPLVKNVVDTFISKLMNFDGKNEEKFNFDWGKNYQKTLDKKAEKEKAEKQAQEQIIKDKITDKSEIKFYSANYDLTAENVLDTLKSTLDNEVLKAALKSYAVDECHLSETSFNNIYSNAIDDTAKYYEAEIKKSEENTYSVAGKEVFDILIEKFNEKIQKALKERNEGLIKAADTGKITGYGSASYNKVDDIIDNLGKADGVLGTRLHTWANGQYGTISDGRWKTLYDQAIEECKKEKFNKDTNGNYAVKDVVDKFLEKLGNILSGYDFSQVDYTTLQDYKNNKKISGKIEDWNNFSTIYLLYKKAGEALYEQLKTVNAIKTYIETKFGVKISDTQLEDIMKSIIDIATLYSNDITINSATGDWSYESKTLIDKFNSALIDYVKNNNPQTKVYTTTDLAGIDYNGEYKDCFTAVDRGYKLNLTKINEKFKDYIEKVGSILNLVDVKSAINWNKIHSQEITNKEGTLMNSVGSSKDTKVSLQFKINSNGSITFVNKDSSSVFQDTKNNNTDTLFNTTLKNGLFTTYSSELTALFGDDKTDKDNLFNLALKMALSSDKFNLYDDIKAEDVIKLVNDYFVKIMLKIQNSNEAMEYVKNYNFEGSYLNGKTTSNLSDIYTYGSTGGNDDWVAIEETTTTNKHIDEGTTTVNYIHIEQYDDNDASKLDAVKINDAMDKLLDKYIERYVTKGNYFDIKAVVEYFAKAQTSAISKLKNGIESDDKSVYKNIYGYGNNDQYDTYHNNNRYKFVTVQAVLIQIMFEMEALINNAILLDGISVPSAGSTPPTSSGSSTTSSGSSTTSSGSSTTSSTPSTGTSDNATSGLTDEEINEIFESNKDETYNSLFHVSEKWYNINDLQDIFNKLGSNKFNLLFEPKSGVGNMQQYCLRSGLQATINGKTYNIKTVEALRCAIDNGFELKHETYGSINYNQ